MIGNLGNVSYSRIINRDGNNGNTGNTASKTACVVNPHHERLFPWHENRPGTAGTRGAKSASVPVVPEGLNITGNNFDNGNIIEKQIVIKTVPDVLDVPANKLDTADTPKPLAALNGHDIRSMPTIGRKKASGTIERKACYCCKGTDYWISRITGDAICRKCHQPAPGAERIKGD